MQTEPWDLGFLPASHRVSDWKVHHCGCADPAGLDGDADSDTRVPSRWCSRCCSTPQSPTGKRRMAPVVLLWRPWQLCTGSQSITVLNSVLIFIPGPSSLDAQGVDAAPPGGWVWLIVPASIFPFSEHPPPLPGVQIAFLKIGFGLNPKPSAATLSAWPPVRGQGLSVLPQDFSGSQVSHHLQINTWEEECGPTAHTKCCTLSAPGQLRSRSRSTARCTSYVQKRLDS